MKNKDDEISKNKAKYDYDLAILNEKAKYSETKIHEINSSYEELQKRYEEFIKSSKTSEETNLLKDKLNRTLKDYNNLKEKIDNYIYQINSLESEKQKILYEKDNEINKLNDKLNDSINTNKDNEKKLKIKIESLIKQFDEINKMNISDKETYNNQITLYKTQLKNKEEEFNELQCTFEREKIILNSRISHLEDFKQKLAQDLTESTTNFEQSINHLKNRSKLEKEKLEKNHETIVKSMESRYNEITNQYKKEIDNMKNELIEKDKIYKNDKTELINQINKHKSNDYMKFEQR